MIFFHGGGGVRHCDPISARGPIERETLRFPKTIQANEINVQLVFVITWMTLMSKVVNTQVDLQFKIENIGRMNLLCAEKKIRACQGSNLEPSAP